jgi:short-subunit dehydrogenase involved in D-alanine esterification of teichoic acids
MKVSITGHTRGIGRQLYNYFSKDSNVVGFSKSTGYNISSNHDRLRIVDESVDCDVFVNNAYSDQYPDSQLELLKLIHSRWASTDKIIINISSRFTEGDNVYAKSKKDLDNFCLTHSRDSVYIINLKPGLTDTLRVSNQSGNKMHTKDIISTLDFILVNKNNFRVHNISFGL